MGGVCGFIVYTSTATSRVFFLLCPRLYDFVFLVHRLLGCWIDWNGVKPTIDSGGCIVDGFWLRQLYGHMYMLLPSMWITATHNHSSTKQQKLIFFRLEMWLATSLNKAHEKRSATKKNLTFFYRINVGEVDETEMGFASTN